MSKEKKMTDNGARKKSGRFKKFVKIVVGVFAALFLIGVFFGDDAEPQQKEEQPAEVDSVAETDGVEEEAGAERSEPETDVKDGGVEPEAPIENAENAGREEAETEKSDQSKKSDEYICTISEYSFQDEKSGKKLTGLYEKALEADRDEFICVTEEEKVHMFKNTETSYKKSLDTDSAPFRYYGEVNGDGEPDGVGMLVRNWDELYRDASDMPGWTKVAMQEEDYYAQDKKEIYVEIVYLGAFKDGFKEGYGIDFGSEGLYGIPIVASEGTFRHGRMDGSARNYVGLAGDTHDDAFDEMVMEAFLVEYSETVDNGLKFPAVVKSNLYFEGNYKDGERDGEGKEYYPWENENNKPCLKYEGNFKNGAYSGKGILYFEDGTLWYEGEFRNGKYDGKGILYDEQGNVLHEGKFKDGEVE